MPSAVTNLKKIEGINEYFAMESTDKKLNKIIKNIKKMIKGNENTDILQVLSKAFSYIQTLFNY